MSEHDLQTAAVNWFRYQYPKLKNLLFAIPNGGHRHIKVAQKLKAEGVLSGVFDLFLVLPEQTYNGEEWILSSYGLFIETKFGKNKLTDNQKQFQKEVESQGYKTAVYYTIEEFQQIIKDYFTSY